MIADPFLCEERYQPKVCHEESPINIEHFWISREINSRIGMEACTLCDETHPAAKCALAWHFLATCETFQVVVWQFARW
jgi:hypothetical protein